MEQNNQGEKAAGMKPAGQEAAGQKAQGQDTAGQETLEEKEKKNQEYNAYVKQVTPTHSLDKETAGSWCSLLLVLLSVLLTGVNIYPSVANWGGAGALVPITGFANSVAAPAIEFQKEGQVFGIGCKIFTIAGPVILYGIFTSWVLGVVYWGLKLMGVF